MTKQNYKELWEEICFILHERIRKDISEKDFEYQVLRSIEKLGWSEFKGEFEKQPVLPIGRKGSIRPDIVIYGPNKKALVVIEIKRPAEDLAKDYSAGQLKSYMRQMKSDFGLLVGKEIRVYYDGLRNPQPEPLLLDRIQFDKKSEDGERFVAIFNREDFLQGNYETFLNNLIERHKAKRNIRKLRESLVTKETEKKLFKFLRNEYSEYGSDIVEEALEALIINLSLKPSETEIRAKPTKKQQKQPDSSMGMRESIFNIVKDHKTGISKSEIINISGYGYRQVGNALHSLSLRGLVKSKGRGIWIPLKENYRTELPNKKPAQAKRGEPIGIKASVFNVIKKYRRGVSIQKIMDKTGLEKRQVRNALHRLSKKGRVKSVSTGVYIAIE
jgi:hypothetical protein